MHKAGNDTFSCTVVTDVLTVSWHLKVARAPRGGLAQLFHTILTREHLQGYAILLG